jgi:hypothetical protein
MKTLPVITESIDTTKNPNIWYQQENINSDYKELLVLSPSLAKSIKTQSQFQKLQTKLSYLSSENIDFLLDLKKETLDMLTYETLILAIEIDLENLPSFVELCTQYPAIMNDGRDGFYKVFNNYNLKDLDFSLLINCLLTNCRIYNQYFDLDKEKILKIAIKGLGVQFPTGDDSTFFTLVEFEELIDFSIAMHIDFELLLDKLISKSDVTLNIKDYLDFILRFEGFLSDDDRTYLLNNLSYLPLIHTNKDYITKNSLLDRYSLEEVIGLLKFSSEYGSHVDHSPLEFDILMTINHLGYPAINYSYLLFTNNEEKPEYGDDQEERNTGNDKNKNRQFVPLDLDKYQGLFTDFGLSLLGFKDSSNYKGSIGGYIATQQDQIFSADPKSIYQYYQNGQKSNDIRPEDKRKIPMVKSFQNTISQIANSSNNDKWEVLQEMYDSNPGDFRVNHDYEVTEIYKPATEGEYLKYKHIIQLLGGDKIFGQESIPSVKKRCLIDKTITFDDLIILLKDNSNFISHNIQFLKVDRSMILNYFKKFKFRSFSMGNEPAIIKAFKKEDKVFNELTLTCNDSTSNLEFDVLFKLFYSNELSNIDYEFVGFSDLNQINLGNKNHALFELFAQQSSKFAEFWSFIKPTIQNITIKEFYDLWPYFRDGPSTQELDFMGGKELNEQNLKEIFITLDFDDNILLNSAIIKHCFKKFCDFKNAEFGKNDSRSIENTIQQYQQYRTSDDYQPIDERYQDSQPIEIQEYKLRTEYSFSLRNCIERLESAFESEVNTKESSKTKMSQSIENTLSIISLTLTEKQKELPSNPNIKHAIGSLENSYSKLLQLKQYIVEDNLTLARFREVIQEVFKHNELKEAVLEIFVSYVIINRQRLANKIEDAIKVKDVEDFTKLYSLKEIIQKDLLKYWHLIIGSNVSSNKTFSKLLPLTQFDSDLSEAGYITDLKSVEEIEQLKELIENVIEMQDDAFFEKEQPYNYTLKILFEKVQQLQLEGLEFKDLEEFKLQTPEQIELMLNHPITRPFIQQLAILRTLKRFPGQVTKLRNFADNPYSFRNINQFKEFLSHSLKQETWSKIFKTKDLAKMYLNSFSTPNLENEIEINQAKNKKRSTTSIQFKVRKGLALEFSGQLSNACWASRYKSINQQKPQFSTVMMIENGEKIAGGGLLIEHTGLDGKDYLIARGFNPLLEFCDRVNCDQLLEEFIKYIKEQAIATGRIPCIVIDDHTGGSASNREAIYLRLKELESNLKHCTNIDYSDEKVEFNTYQLQNEIFEL